MTFVYGVKNTERQGKWACCNARAAPGYVSVTLQSIARLPLALVANNERVDRFLCTETQGTDNRSIDLAGVVARVCLRAMRDHP